MLPQVGTVDSSQLYCRGYFCFGSWSGTCGLFHPGCFWYSYALLSWTGLATAIINLCCHKLPVHMPFGANTLTQKSVDISISMLWAHFGNTTFKLGCKQAYLTFKWDMGEKLNWGELTNQRGNRGRFGLRPRQPTLLGDPAIMAAPSWWHLSSLPLGGQGQFWTSLSEPFGSSASQFNRVLTAVYLGFYYDIKYVFS